MIKLIRNIVFLLLVVISSNTYAQGPYLNGDILVTKNWDYDPFNPPADIDGTLRWAITKANNQTTNSGPDHIIFSTNHHIQLLSQLPTIFEETYIDGSTFSGYSLHTNMVEISGLLTSGVRINVCFIIYTHSNSIIKGIYIHDFRGYGINVVRASSGAVMENIQIVDNIINRIIGGIEEGIDIEGNYHLIKNNLIGMDLSSDYLGPRDGIVIRPTSHSNQIGGVSLNERNIIQADRHGIINAEDQNNDWENHYNLFSRNLIFGGNGYAIWNQVSIYDINQVNDNKQKPTITTANTAGFVEGTCELFDRIEIFEGDGSQDAENYLFTVDDTDGDGLWSASGLTFTKAYVTATATDKQGKNLPDLENTSELANRLLDILCPEVSINVEGQCLGDPSYFYVQTSNLYGATIINYEWNFADGTEISGIGNITGVPNTTGTYSSPDHTYAAGGVYPATVTIELSNGCIVSGVPVNTFNGTPAALVVGLDPTFTVSPNPAIAGQPVTFTYTGNDFFNSVLGTTFTFDYGDGNVVSGTQVLTTGTTSTYTYTNPGSYTGVLTMSYKECDYQYEVEIEVTPPPCPTGVIVTSSNCIGEEIDFQVDSPDDLSGYSFLWTYQDEYTTTDHFTMLFSTIGIQMVSVVVTGPGGCSFIATLNLSVIDCKCCETVLPTPSINISQLQNIGHFYTDNGTGQIVWQNNNCPDLYPFDCIKTPIELQGADGVISASVVTLSDNWKDDPDDFFTREKLYPTANAALVPNIFETGEANKWRVEKTYTYREKIDQNGQDKNYNRGTFPITMFDWKNEGNNDPNKWVKTSTITKYSPNGQAIEEENILKIKSTAQYGYNGTLQTAVAQNAGNHAICFESFENTYTIGSNNKFFENGISFDPNKGIIENGIAHTGNSSIKLNHLPQGDAFTVGNIKVSDDIMDDGLLVKMWVYIDKTQPDPVTEITLDFAKVNQAWFNLSTQMYKISSSGEWMLYEGVISSTLLSTAGIVAGNDISVGIRYDFGLTGLPNIAEIGDDFDGGFDPLFWTSVSGHQVGVCSCISGSNLTDALLFIETGPRIAETKDMDMSFGQYIKFDLNYGVNGNPGQTPGSFGNGNPCDELDGPHEEVVLEYSLDLGSTWTLINQYSVYIPALYNGYLSVSELIPFAAKDSQVRFRLRQKGTSSCNGCLPPDNWSIDNFKITFLVSAPGSYDVYIDDVRMQPKYSEMACYVYDKAQRLTAAFDDQHYALIYQYNAEGILIRKMKETVRGVKTISETQYNSKGTNR